MKSVNIDEIGTLVADSKHIAILQADNPDGDSLASALALEEILGNLNLQPVMYCGVDIPKHLQHLSGWDRVQKELPKNIDLSIVVDCSAISLFEIAVKRKEFSWVLTKPMIIIDHHEAEITIPAQYAFINNQAVATGEIIYEISKYLNWPMSEHTNNMLAISILSDSLGLMTDSTTAKSIRVIADLVESGVKLAQLDEARRQTLKKSAELTRYKGRLLQRIEYSHDQRVAHITIPWDEIEKYSNEYNPSMLVLEDMRLTEGTQVAIAFKTYDSGRVTAKIRCNYGFAVAGQLAEFFGGGGHSYASGFKIDNCKDFEELKRTCVNKALELLDQNHEIV